MKAIGNNADALAYRKPQSVIKLSPREAECVVRYLKEGRLKPVAEQMGVSIYTARRQKENAMRKLGATNSAELLLLALKRGIVSVK